MSKTKNCPACQKELPVLAVRCKYCGFKLSSKPVEATARESFTGRESEAPMVRLSSTPPPPPPPARRPSVPPPPAPAAGVSKKTMMMGAVAAPRPVGMGRMANTTMPLVPERGTIPPPPIAKVQTPLRPSAPPPPPPARSGASPAPTPSLPPRPPALDLDGDLLDLGSLDSDGEETGAWIPEPTSRVDESALLELDTDDSGVVELPEHHAPAAVKKTDVADEDFFEEDEAQGAFLLRYVFRDATLDSWEERGWPAWLVKIAGKLRYAYAIAAAVLLLGGIAAIAIAIASAGSDVTPGAVADAPPAPPKAPAAPPTAPSPPDSPPAPAETTPVQTPTPAVETSAAGAVPQPGKSCRPFADFPAMPWKDSLEKALSSLGKSAVCQAFGEPSARLASAFAPSPQVGPGGLDAVAGGGLLEVFSTGTAVRNGPSMELLFAGDRLYEIRLNFRDTPGVELGAKAIAEALETEAQEIKDHLGRKRGRVVDGDLVIEYFEEKWYGRTLKTLVFASAQIRDFLAATDADRERAEAAIAKGDGLFGKWKFEEALEAYREATAAIDRLGAAHVKQALMLTRLERFDEVEKAARKALEVSGEARTRAEALGLLAVTALYGEDKAAALAHFEKAASTDPANGFFRMSADELQTGEYSTERVARTAARMECLKKKSYKSTFRGLLARGNFPDMKTYFDVLKKAKADPAFEKLRKEASRGECN